MITSTDELARACNSLGAEEALRRINSHAALVEACQLTDEFCNKVNSGEFDATGTIQAIQHTVRAALAAAS